MLQFLFFILLVFILIVVFGLLFIGNIVRAFLHLGRRQSNNSSQQQERGEYHEEEQSKKQVFSDDEGEYVDFEEVKDNDTKDKSN